VITKAVYENGVLRPLEKLNLRQGEEVEIEIKDAVLRTRGIIKLDPEIAREIADGDEFSVLVG
jgi:predicted DNA-binding antitoxin AbrB/MazE fold protein